MPNVYKDIETVNLTLPKYYAVYFPFFKEREQPESALNDCHNPCLFVRQKKNSKNVYEIIGDAAAWEVAKAQNIGALHCQILNLTDTKAKIFSLEKMIGTGRLTIVQDIICNRELARLGKRMALKNLLSSVKRNNSSSTYRRAAENVRFFLAEIGRLEITAAADGTPGEAPADIEVIRSVLERLDADAMPESHKLLAYDFRWIYYDSNKDYMTINKFNRMYYKKSDQAKENRATYPAETGILNKKIETLIADLTDAGGTVEKILKSKEHLKSGKNTLTRKAVSCLKEKPAMIPALKSLSEQLKMIFKELNKTERAESALFPEHK